MIIYAFISGWDSFRYQYKIPQWRDTLWYGTNRLILVVGSFIILFSVLVGRFNFLSSVLRTDYFRSISKVTFPAGLVTGIIATSVMCGQEVSLNLVNQISAAIGCGLILVSMGIGFLIYVFVEYPMYALINWTIIPSLSFSRQIKIHQLQLLKESGVIDATGMMQDYQP
jgi:hypothetical protein